MQSADCWTFECAYLLNYDVQSYDPACAYEARHRVQGVNEMLNGYCRDDVYVDVESTARQAL